MIFMNESPIPSDMLTDPDVTLHHHPGEQPTRVRYLVLAFLAAMTFILYLDRSCISQAAPAIQKELHISETQKAMIFNAFALAYALFEIPAGRWGDRFGSRRIVTRIVLWWSFFTALTGAAGGFLSLVIIRFLFGAGEAGTAQFGADLAGVVSGFGTGTRPRHRHHGHAARRGSLQRDVAMAH